MHLIYITDRHRDTIKLLNNYKVNLIHLDCSPEDLDILINKIGNDNNNLEMSWIRTFFTLHGLKQIAERSGKTNDKGDKNKKNKDTGIDDFISSCCKLSDSAECYAADLYKYYTEYYNQYYGGESLKRAQFAKILKQSGKYVYFRPHHSKNDNRYAFKNISVDIEKFKIAINKDTENLKFEEKQIEINEYLSSMNNLLSGIKLYDDNEMNVKIVKVNCESD